jgi:hypothetical protein
MGKEDLKNKVKGLASSYKNITVQSAQYDEDKGQLTLGITLKGGPQVKDLPPEIELVPQASQENAADTIGEITPLNHFSTSSLRRIEIDPLIRDDLDLLKPSVLQDKPQQIYQRSIRYHQTKEVYGATINVLSNFAAKGFENDIDDTTIKNFYDNWVIDVCFDDLVEKIFFDFFRVGMVRTYKILGKYEPKVNFLSVLPGEKAKKLKKEKAIRRNRFSKSFIPIAYTILNPTMVEIKGSLMFGQTATFLKKEAGEELKKLLELKSSDLSEFQKKIIDNIPADFKKAVKKGEDIPLEPDLVGEVDYRRMPYERYPLPRGSRAFEAVEFKDELRKADYSTLDGITNYILKITVENDNHPVKKQETLERVAELFDTVSKSYKVVWNHTLDVEKITSPEIGEVLGPDKYRQVNGDITAGLGLVRALIDGTGEVTPSGAELAVKSIIEEINYARRQVSRWIYNEYRDVAKAMNFERFPRVRFDDMALRDELAMMTIVQGMIDRRIISYRTGQKKLGFDPDTELAQLKEEKKLVLNGDLGLVGSPFQQPGRGLQPNQRTPRGTPSEGRPKERRPGKTPEKKDKTKPPTESSSIYEKMFETLQEMSLEDVETMLVAVREQMCSYDKEDDVLDSDST